MVAAWSLTVRLRCNQVKYSITEFAGIVNDAEDTQVMTERPYNQNTDRKGITE